MSVGSVGNSPRATARSSQGPSTEEKNKAWKSVLDNAVAGMKKFEGSLEYLGDNRIEDVAFEGRGCAISTASASLMTELLKGKTEAEANALFGAFHHMCTQEDAAPELPAALEDEFDRLQVLSGVRQYPMRVKCATLAWHTMKAALDGAEKASTE